MLAEINKLSSLINNDNQIWTNSSSKLLSYSCYFSYDLMISLIISLISSSFSRALNLTFLKASNIDNTCSLSYFMALTPYFFFFPKAKDNLLFFVFLNFEYSV